MLAVLLVYLLVACLVCYCDCFCSFCFGFGDEYDYGRIAFILTRWLFALLLMFVIVCALRFMLVV